MYIETQSEINIASLENDFRQFVKQHRALLRWGVDKVFDPSEIKNLLLNTRRLLDSKELKEAQDLLSTLRKKLNVLEQEYPAKKSETENLLRVDIFRLETDIMLAHADDDVEIETVHDLLKTLEIARVAMQNEDWPEARARIDEVGHSLLIIVDEKKSNISVEPNSEDASKKSVQVSTAEKTLETEPESKEVDLSQESSEIVQETTPKNVSIINEFSSELIDKLVSTAQKSVQAKMVSVQELIKTFQMLNKSQVTTYIVGFVTDSKNIENTLWPYSRTPLTSTSGKPLTLLRLPLSRTNTVYVIGIPEDIVVGNRGLVSLISYFNTMSVDLSYGIEGKIAELSDSFLDMMKQSERILLMNKETTRLFSESEDLNTLGSHSVDVGDDNNYFEKIGCDLRVNN